ncbi:MAG: asparagine--tRNA ligase [Sphingobacteriales bacterium]|nr:MAG: asparagine--tRNA ligase [Sphingobacteriales bacterium]
MPRTKISTLLADANPVGKSITVQGWVRHFRNNQFIALTDGSCPETLQCVVRLDLDEAIRKDITAGAALSISGTVAESLGKGQRYELIADTVTVLGTCDPEVYPLQLKNRPSLDFLREHAHLRFRTATFSAIFRIRHTLAMAVHRFFDERGFVYLHTPIITASDAEGAGEMFRVTTLPLNAIPIAEGGDVDFEPDFFGRATNLTVSGQLEAELGAMALGEVYTFGPTFRAENSNTTRHLAEFWMIEPEVAFNTLTENADLAEAFIQYVIKAVLQERRGDLDFLATRLAEEEKQKPQAERSELGLIEKLEFVIDQPFERITYTEAINILLASPAYKKKKFKYDVQWGIDLQSEHERYLVEKHFGKPVIVTNYPKAIKAFYMRQDDGTEAGRETVAAMDILVPGIGEMVGGSQREERLDKLQERMQEMHIPEEELYWYLDTRRFGTAPHAGFGLGFERLVLFVTGMGNIRDVIPFPRTPGNATF